MPSLQQEIAHFMQKQEIKSKRRSGELEGPSSWREHRAMMSQHDRRAARDRQVTPQVLTLCLRSTLQACLAFGSAHSIQSGRIKRLSREFWACWYLFPSWISMTSVSYLDRLRLNYC